MNGFQAPGANFYLFSGLRVNGLLQIRVFTFGNRRIIFAAKFDAPGDLGGFFFAKIASSGHEFTKLVLKVKVNNIVKISQKLFFGKRKFNFVNNNHLNV